MEVPIMQLPPGDPRTIDKIVYELKSQGIFDQFRKECLADVDTKPAYQNLHQRVEGTVSGFLANQVWRPDLNKNQLRDSLRKHINESGFLDLGVERIVDQVVNPKILTVFMPQVEDVVYKYLGIEKPPKKREYHNSLYHPHPLDVNPVKRIVTLSDLLPKDLDPISPESDKLNDDDDDDRNVEDADHQGPVDEEESSPPFEPIEDIRSHIEESSMDSHLSGISGLTSHDSQVSFHEAKCPDITNNDSQLSQVSSGSRLSIVSTEFPLQNRSATEDSQQSKMSIHDERPPGDDGDNSCTDFQAAKQDSVADEVMIENSRVCISPTLLSQGNSMDTMKQEEDICLRRAEDHIADKVNLDPGDRTFSEANEEVRSRGVAIKMENNTLIEDQQNSEIVPSEVDRTFKMEVDMEKIKSEVVKDKITESEKNNHKIEDKVRNELETLKLKSDTDRSRSRSEKERPKQESDRNRIKLEAHKDKSKPESDKGKIKQDWDKEKSRSSGEKKRIQSESEKVKVDDGKKTPELDDRKHSEKNRSRSESDKERGRSEMRKKEERSSSSKGEKKVDKSHDEKDKLKDKIRRNSESSGASRDGKEVKRSESHSSDSEKRKADKDRHQKDTKNRPEKPRHEDRDKSGKEKSRQEEKTKSDEKKSDKESSKEKSGKYEDKDRKERTKSEPRKENNRGKPDDKNKTKHDSKEKEKAKGDAKGGKTDKEKSSKNEHKEHSSTRESRSRHDSRSKPRADGKENSTKTEDKSKDRLHSDEKENKEKMYKSTERERKEIINKKRDETVSLTKSGEHKSKDKDAGKKSKGSKSKTAVDDHRIHRDKHSEDRRSADRDSNGKTHDQTGGPTSQTNGTGSHQHTKTGGDSSSGKSSDTSGNSDSAQSPSDAASSDLATEKPPAPLSPPSSLPFKKRPHPPQTNMEILSANDEYCCTNEAGKLFLKKKPKIAANRFEIHKIMKLRKTFGKLEKKLQDNEKFSRNSEARDTIEKVDVREDKKTDVNRREEKNHVQKTGDKIKIHKSSDNNKQVQGAKHCDSEKADTKSEGKTFNKLTKEEKQITPKEPKSDSEDTGKVVNKQPESVKGGRLAEVEDRLRGEMRACFSNAELLQVSRDRLTELLEKECDIFLGFDKEDDSEFSKLCVFPEDQFLTFTQNSITEMSTEGSGLEEQIVDEHFEPSLKNTITETLIPLPVISHSAKQAVLLEEEPKATIKRRSRSSAKASIIDEFNRQRPGSSLSSHSDHSIEPPLSIPTSVEMRPPSVASRRSRRSKTSFHDNKETLLVGTPEEQGQNENEEGLKKTPPSKRNGLSATTLNLPQMRATCVGKKLLGYSIVENNNIEKDGLPISFCEEEDIFSDSDSSLDTFPAASNPQKEIKSHEPVNTISEPPAAKKPRLGRSRRVGLSRPRPRPRPPAPPRSQEVPPPVVTPPSDFIMPLSPESDVSTASGEQAKKVLLDPKDHRNLEEKVGEATIPELDHHLTMDTENKRSLRSGSTHAGRGQRYDSDDLYKPRPLFTPGKRRNQSRADCMQEQVILSNTTNKRTATKVTEISRPVKRRTR